MKHAPCNILARLVMKAPAERYVWYRSRGEMPSDPFLHQYLLGYISDFDFYPPHCNLMV